MNIFIIQLIKFYQYAISPLLGSRCRFHPTCSAYAISCFQKFPFWLALWYSSKRILRCNPFVAGGHDPVPHKPEISRN